MEEREFKFCQEMGIWVDEYAEKLILEGFTEEELEKEYEKIKETYSEKLAKKFKSIKEKLLYKKEKDIEYTNYCQRYKKRKEMESLLNNIPEGEQIKINKKLLEELLFEKSKVEYSEDTTTSTYTVKCPIWTGPFLRKIDLSEIDFSYVDWSCGYGIDFPLRNKRIYDYDYKNKKLPKSEYLIDLSHTNANIDFSKAFQTSITKQNKKTNIYKCNFSHLDLSKSNTEHIHRIESSDLSYTNYKINGNYYELKATKITFEEQVSEDTILGSEERYIEDSNLEGNNMENITIEAWDLCTNIKNTNLKDTKIKIIDEESDPMWLDIIYEELVPIGYLNNCYIKDELINTPSKVRKR